MRPDRILQAKEEWELIRRWVDVTTIEEGTRDLEHIVSEANITKNLEDLANKAGFAQVRRGTGGEVRDVVNVVVEAAGSTT